MELELIDIQQKINRLKEAVKERDIAGKEIYDKEIYDTEYYTGLNNLIDYFERQFECKAEALRRNVERRFNQKMSLFLTKNYEIEYLFSSDKVLFQCLKKELNKHNNLEPGYEFFYEHFIYLNRNYNLSGEQFEKFKEEVVKTDRKLKSEPPKWFSDFLELEIYFNENKAFFNKALYLETITKLSENQSLSKSLLVLHSKLVCEQAEQYIADIQHIYGNIYPTKEHINNLIIRLVGTRLYNATEIAEMVKSLALSGLTWEEITEWESSY